MFSHIGAAARAGFRPMLLVVSLLSVLIGSHAPRFSASADAGKRAQEAYGRLPMTFEVNRGQVDAEVKFTARGHGYQVFLTDDEAVLRLQSRNDTAALRLTFSGKAREVVGVAPLKTRSHYLIGNDPAAWRTDIPNFARVEYREIRNGVDVAFYGTRQSLEYDFVVAPGADPTALAVNIDGAERLELDANGDLVIYVAGEVVYQRAPLAYQNLRGERRNVTSRYVLLGERQVGFAVDGYDEAQPLVIDPVIDYSTFFGGVGSDEGFAIAVDAAGNAYVTGTTYSNNFNTFAPLQSVNRGGKFDAFVTKINAAGSAILYSTYLGGGGDDGGQGIAVDAAGNAYVAGITNSPDFNTRNPFQATINGAANDAFIAKINADGSALVYSSYLGGSNIDQAFAVAVDVGGNAYVAGATSSADFNTRNPLQTTNRGGADAFVAKLNAAGTALVYSTYLGGSGLDEGFGIAVDAGGQAYVCGGTASNDFNTRNPLQAGNRGGGLDAFAAKLNVNGSQLVYATYLGGGAGDAAYDVAVDASGNAYLAGNTFSTDFNTANPLQAANAGNSDAFVARINADGAALGYATYLGGALNDFGRGIAVDGAGNAYVTGRTASTNFNTANPLQANNRGESDAFVAKLNPGGSQLTYSTYLGGAADDFGFGIAVDNAGNAYVTGDTRSTDFNTRNPLQANNRGGFDAFVTKLNAGGSDLFYSTYLGGSGEDLGLSVALDTAGNAYLTGYTSSNDYATRNPLQERSRGGLDVFVTKLLTDASDIAFNTYFGGNNSDIGYGIAVDGGGNAYLTGATTSTDLPTRNPIQADNRGGLDAFVAKFNANGSNLIYSTYLGGAFGDQGRGVAVDAAGNAFVAGGTFSEDFPAQSALQNSNRGSGDAFIAKLNATGTALTYSTYLGGTNADEATGIAIDNQGNACVTGNTSSTDFNTRNALQANHRGQQDAFVAKLGGDGAQLVFSTYLGGRRNDVGNGIATDAGGNVYVTGATASPDFNTANALQATNGGGDFDAFVTKLNATGAALVYSTYLGGALGDVGNGVAVDGLGNAYVTGVTGSTNFPLRNPLQTSNRGGNDAFITKFNAAGAAHIYSTYLGGGNEDGGAAITVDATGAAYVTGATASADFNIQGPLFSYGGGTDVFVARILSEPALALSPPTQSVQAGATAAITLTIAPPQSTPTTVTLVSSNAAIASVPASVTIPANTGAVNFNVSGAAAGGPVTITATLPQSLGGATATATVNVTTTIAVGYEADVAPRPNGSNGTLTIADWVQVGRFAAGFDTAALGSEFQRADCAPRDTLGNGSLTISDWVQAGRYAAGLDAVVPAGGPSAPNQLQSRTVDCLVCGGLHHSPMAGTRASSGNVRESKPAADRTVYGTEQNQRMVRAVGTTLERGRQATVTIELEAQGNESGLGFSVNFDPAQLTFVSASAGADVANASVNLNTNQAASGRIGMVLALPAGQALATGTRRLLNLTFAAPMNGTASAATVGLGDQPVLREIVNANADALTTAWSAGALLIGRPATNVSAASFLNGEMAAEMIVAAFGSGMATAVQAATTLPLPTTLAGTTVKVRDSLGAERLAPLFFVSPTQINYLVPAGTAAGTALIAITAGNGAVSVAGFNVNPVAPSLFTANASGRGLAAATVLRVQADGTQSFEPTGAFDRVLARFVPVPIDLGAESEQVFLLLFGTGLRGRSGLGGVSARIGGAPAEVTFVGVQSNFAGLDQVNVRLPRGLSGRGEVEINVTVDGKTANAVRVAVK